MISRILTLTTALAGTASALAAQDAAITLDPVEISSALRDDRAVLETPVAVSAREAEDLEAKLAGSFAALINDIPGLTIGGGPRPFAQEPNIRGFNGERVLLRLDGGRFNFNQGHRGRFFVDPALIKRVEVVRGGGSTLYGSGALGGVISIETYDPADLLAPGEAIGARLSLGYGSNGDQRSAAGTVFADWGTVDALLSLSTREAGEDLEAGGGETIPYSAFEQSGGMLKLGIEPTADSRFELSYGLYEDDELTASAPDQFVASDRPLVARDARDERVRLSWDYVPEGSDMLDLSVLLYSETLEITEDRVEAPRLDETRYETLGLEIINRAHADIGVPVDIVYGIEMARDSQEATRDGAERASFPSSEATTMAGFAEATFGVSEALDVIAGLRYDHYARDPGNSALEETSDGFWSPRLGLSYRPTETLQLYGNVARAFRAPSMTEMYNEGEHFSFSIPRGPFLPPLTITNLFIPNPDLKPEESTQIELGLRFEDQGIWRPEDRLSFAISAYHADVKNFVEQTVGATETTTVNVDGELYGLEAELSYDAGAWFAGAGLSLARGESDNDYIASLPQDRLTISAGLRPSAEWELGALATFAAEHRFINADVEAEGEAYRTVDLYAAYTPLSGPLEGSTVRLGVANAFDESYHIYPIEMPMPGRSVDLSVSLAF
ncbi:TonB-dependent hemoglobin/transferrin/lactoferrin family receptor [Poseidonocella sedimentorum]|uniref:Hemoglobin/transferrin/lactoferrin receptor protein n=1 Tax=Poseidonocella sedimentorum TaxID=871652 RepID=A0A1I6E4S8_9RHOB|nr:TonB-dependent hemoglobin/transferrin/lactoferrin family receptor [Poseidonocella sedimentorum]SFR12723.1 hemoglobin/transferrin/lactoferrin receptor protein [Poseidonocella sedimentorum]